MYKMISLYIWLSIGIIYEILTHSKATFAPECENCGCCKDGICNTTFRSWEGRDIEGYCTHGCNLGFGGNRCYNRCPVGCLTCEHNAPLNCLTCTEGYFLSDDERCLECPINCEHCTPGKKCYMNNQTDYSDNESIDCSTSCLNDFNCVIIGVCRSCKHGYFNVSNTCLDACQNTCESCTDKNNCQLCKPSYSGDRCCVRGGHCLLCSSSTACERCVYGYYGNTCNKRCSGTCANVSQESLCEKHNGTCFSCELGFYDDYCTLNCSDGCWNSQCHKDTGYCSDGCKYGYHGPNCTEVSQDKTTIIVTATKTGEVIGIASAVFVAIVILFIVVTILVVRRWKRGVLQKRHEEPISSVHYVNTQTTVTDQNEAVFEYDGTEQFEYERLDEVDDKQYEVYEVINSDI